MFGTCFNLANIEPSSNIYGPGDRFVIWLQGCTLACKGCWNTAMWPHKENELIERQKLLNQIMVTPGIVGVTFLGGEPLQQAENLLWLMRQLSEEGLDIMLYTGYEFDEIQSCNNKQGIFDFVDILISGRYRHSLRNTNLLWRGSENQKVNFLTAKYNETTVSECNQVEIHIGEFGELSILGYPEQELINVLSKPGY